MAHRGITDSLRLTSSALRGVSKRLRLFDLLLLAVIPAVLVSVYSLPIATRETLVFRYLTPTLWSALTAPFVHFAPGHLGMNLLGYAFVVIALYVLSVASNTREEFLVVFVSLSITCPILLSYMNLAFVRHSVFFGFSGVLMAYYGYLPLTLAEHLEARLDFGPTQTVAPLFFFIGIWLMTLQTLRAVLANPVSVPIRGEITPVSTVLVGTLVQIMLVLLLVTVLYSRYVVDIEKPLELRKRLARVSRDTGHFELSLAMTILFVTIPFAMFPIDPIADGGVYNLYVHFVGYALGFVASYVFYSI